MFAQKGRGFGKSKYPSTLENGRSQIEAKFWPLCAKEKEKAPFFANNKKRFLDNCPRWFGRCKLNVWMNDGISRALISSYTWQTSYIRWILCECGWHPARTKGSWDPSEPTADLVPIHIVPPEFLSPGNVLWTHFLSLRRFSFHIELKCGHKSRFLQWKCHGEAQRSLGWIELPLLTLWFNLIRILILFFIFSSTTIFHNLKHHLKSGILLLHFLHCAHWTHLFSTASLSRWNSNKDFCHIQNRLNLRFSLKCAVYSASIRDRPWKSVR